MNSKLLLVLIVLIGTSYAFINMVSPIPDYTYFSDEEIQVLGSIGFENCSGTATLFVDGRETSEASFRKGAVYKIEDLFTNNSFQLNAGEHYLTITTDCGEKKTVYFKVKDKLEIVYSINGDKFMTGDLLRVSAYAFKKEKINNITKIEINNESFIDNALIVLEKPGNYTVVIRAEDDAGDSAEKEINIQVFNELRLEVSADKEELKPGERLSLSVLCFDVFNSMRACNASAYWFGEQLPISNLIVPENTSPGDYTVKIVASNGSNTGEAELVMKVLRIPVVKELIVNDDWFEVVSTDQEGNSFTTEVNVSFYNKEGELVKEETVLTNNKYEIKLPPGTYSIVVNAAGKSFEKQEKLGTTQEPENAMTGLVVAKKRATLIAGLVIIALTVIAVLLQRQQSKKKQ